MAGSSEAKLREARDHLKEAEKCMKTGIFKWKPDFEGAALELGKAAISFKNAKSLSDAADCYLRLSEVEQQHGSIFQAAKALEASAMLQKELGEWTKAADLIDRASTLYMEHGTGDTAIITLSRGAKMIESTLPENAIKLYAKACHMADVQDRPKDSADNIGKAGRILLKLKKLDEAAEYVTKELDFLSKTEHAGTLYKLVMGLVLIHLHREDYVAANQALSRAAGAYPGFYESEEAGQISQLLKAYDEGDQDKALQIARGPLFAFMENEFTKLARDLKVPGSGEPGGDDNDEGLL